jgi:CDP-diacylglycerol--glycerol-3-phosphate 3-phosphatidyltransferase
MLRRFWTISNFFSSLRIVLIVPVSYCYLAGFPHHRLWTVILLLAAIGTDCLDGYCARLWHQVTDWGKIIDPLADKIAVTFYAILLVSTHAIPLWYFIAVVARDVLLFFGGIYILKKKRIIPQSNIAGKIAVGSVAIVFLLATLQIARLDELQAVALWSSVVILAWSFVLYTKRLWIGRDARTEG